MSDFKEGDKVRVVSSIYTSIIEGEVGEIIKIYSNIQVPSGQRYVVQVADKIPLRFFARELELVDQPLIGAGARVRCIKEGRYFGKEGTVVSVRTDATAPYNIKWDGASLDSVNGGHWTRGAVEEITQQQDDSQDEEIAQLKGLLYDCHWLFSYYAKQHASKGTNKAMYKALMNQMMTDRISDVIETDS